jgi:hypothetical protein
MVSSGAIHTIDFVVLEIIGDVYLCFPFSLSLFGMFFVIVLFSVWCCYLQNGINERERRVRKGRDKSQLSPFLPTHPFLSSPFPHRASTSSPLSSPRPRVMFLVIPCIFSANL